MAVNPTIGTKTAVTVSGLSTLAATTYAVANAVTHSTSKPVDVVYEVTLATTNTVAGNKRANVFAQVSLDGTNYTTGPVSGSSQTDEPDLILLGSVPMNSSSTNHTSVFSLGQRLGFVPASSKIIIYNDCGVALTSGTVNYAEISVP